MDQFSLLPKAAVENKITKKGFSIFLIIFLVELAAIIVLIAIFFVADRKKQDLESNLASIKAQQLAITDANYSVFQSKKTFLRELQAGQIFWSEVLNIIKSNTSGNVEFVSFSSEPSKNKIFMKAKTISFEDAALQLQMFREVDNFSNVEISQIISDKRSGTLFDISLTYNKLKNK